MKKKIIILSFVLILIVIISCYIFHTRTRVVIDSLFYDCFHSNQYVSSKDQIESILATFPKVSLKELPKEYSSKAELLDKKFKSYTQKQKFYVLTRKDCYQKIIGNNRIADIIAKDSRFSGTWYFSNTKLYLGIDKRILFKAIDLQDHLEGKGFNRDGFKVRSGHRTPKHNKRVGGASKSRHIKGEALDLVIGDINNDGKYSKEDKEIVLKICDKYIIGKQGGIGLYPGTQSVHIDVRGYKARWNSF